MSIATQDFMDCFHRAITSPQLGGHIGGTGSSWAPRTHKPRPSPSSNRGSVHIHRVTAGVGIPSQAPRPLF